jgi:hypothetical protein
MATTTHIPLEVYLRSDYQPDAEYIDGELLGRMLFVLGFEHIRTNGTFASVPNCASRSKQKITSSST